MAPFGDHQNQPIRILRAGRKVAAGWTFAAAGCFAISGCDASVTNSPQGLGGGSGAEQSGAGGSSSGGATGSGAVGGSGIGTAGAISSYAGGSGGGFAGSGGGFAGSGGFAGGGGSGGSSGKGCGVPTSFEWTSTGPIITPKSDATHNLTAIKDPTVFFYDGQWNVYASSSDNSGNYNSVFLSFTDFDSAGSANQQYLQGGVAPQVFYFAAKDTWYRVYEWPDAYATSTDPT
ncbi:MAG TPA: non-reducing end alpha-L-arabinofuranosidase family hydrolase, partial [Polyangiaceae bacterium]|nr:non-reducing end alpha-L-arabinofuranosidase family hydrolase [Polyangiaceae bacterium]